MHVTTIAPLDRGRIADRIIDDLRDRIARNELPRGTRLPAERELAVQYGVSGATVREAMRALASMGFLEVRHGSGAYVTAGNDRLVATALGTLIQLEPVSIADILGILSVLHRHAASLAVGHATEADILALEAAAGAVETGRDAEGLASALGDFLHALAAATHSPLLAALCNFLSDLQIRLALDQSRHSARRWQTMTGALAAERAAVVAALRRRDRAELEAAMDRYSAAAMTLVVALPYGRRQRIPGTPLAGALAALRDARD
jgi:GntR family transcriptional repressor for pyruvate dehydrogenase complex